VIVGWVLSGKEVEGLLIPADRVIGRKRVARGVTGATRMANASVTVSIRNVSANRLLTDDDDLDDEDYFKG